MPPCSTSTGRRRHGFAARTASPWSPGPRTCSRSPAPLPLLPTSLGTGSAATWHPHLPVWADDQDSGRGRTERGRSAMRARTRRAGAALATAGGVVLLRPGTRANRVLRRQVDLMARRLRYLAGRLQGASYRLRGRHPDADVSDLVLTDRIRSVIGPLEKRLDLPHIHVLVEDHVALLHGVAASDQDAGELEEAVAGASNSPPTRVGTFSTPPLAPASTPRSPSRWCGRSSPPSLNDCPTASATTLPHTSRPTFEPCSRHHAAPGPLASAPSPSSWPASAPPAR